MLRGGPRPPTPVERWTLRLGVGFAAFSIVAIAWAMSDVDGDGLASIDEVQMGMNPLDGDSDNDGASDGWEMKQAGGDKHATQDGRLPCGVLEPCAGPAAEAEPEPPRVSSQTATGVTVGVALLGVSVAVVAALWVGRRWQ